MFRRRQVSGRENTSTASRGDLDEDSSSASERIAIGPPAADFLFSSRSDQRFALACRRFTNSAPESAGVFQSAKTSIASLIATMVRYPPGRGRQFRMRSLGILSKSGQPPPNAGLASAGAWTGPRYARLLATNSRFWMVLRERASCEADSFPPLCPMFGVDRDRRRILLIGLHVLSRRLVPKHHHHNVVCTIMLLSW